MKLYEFKFRNDEDTESGFIWIIAHNLRNAIKLANTKLQKENYNYRVGIADIIDDDLEISNKSEEAIYEVIYP